VELRDYASAVSLLSGDRIVHCYLIEYEAISGMVRYNTSGWDIDWLEETWFAGHGVIGLDIAEENVNLQMHGSSIKIAALNPAVVSQALSQNNRGRYGGIYHAMFHPETYKLVEVTREWSGRVSSMVLTKPGSNGAP
jgi:hypothetical protein